MVGPPEDRQWFADNQLPRLREAAVDMRFLLSRGYPQRSAVTLVGNHRQLAKRQRQALFRSVMASSTAETVQQRTVKQLRDAVLLVDGYNVLITYEIGQAGGLLLQSDDAFLRDIGELHGSYRAGPQSAATLVTLCAQATQLGATAVRVFLDAPMHGSQRLASAVREVGVAAETVRSADGAIRQALRETPGAVVASSDSALLRDAPRGFDLPRHAFARDGSHPWVISLQAG